MKIHRIVLITISLIIVLFMIYIIVETKTPLWLTAICTLSLIINLVSAGMHLGCIFANDLYVTIGSTPEKEIDEKEEAFNQLNHVNIKYIEQYLRMKKLNKLK